jgi:hypothetical protein
MKAILISLVLYLTGIALLLFLRPAIMFHRDGRWKEFGVSGDDTTVFPLWMFCIVWAVVTYGVGRFFFGGDAPKVEDVVRAATAASLTAAIPPSNPSGPQEQSKPGYYKLNTKVLKKKGIPMYVYVGEDAPSDLEDDEAAQ